MGSNLGATHLVRLGSLLASFDEMMWSVALYDISLNKLLWTCKLQDMPEPYHHGFNDEKKISIRISGNGVVAVCKNIIDPTTRVLQMHCWIFEAGKCSGKITSAELTETRKNFGEKSLYFVSDRAKKLTEFDLEHKTLKTSALMEHHFLLKIYQFEDLELTKKTSKIKGLLLKDIDNEVWVEDYNVPSRLLTQPIIKEAPQSVLLALQKRRQFGTFVPISIARALQVKHSPEPITFECETDISNGIARCGKYAAVLHARRATLSLCDLAAQTIIWTMNISKYYPQILDPTYNSFGILHLSVSNLGKIVLQRDRYSSIAHTIDRFQQVTVIGGCNSKGNSVNLLGERIFKAPEGYIMRSREFFPRSQPQCKLQEICLDEEGKSYISHTWELPHNEQILDTCHLTDANENYALFFVKYREADHQYLSENGAQALVINLKNNEMTTLDTKHLDESIHGICLLENIIFAVFCNDYQGHTTIVRKSLTDDSEKRVVYNKLFHFPRMVALDSSKLVITANESGIWYVLLLDLNKQTFEKLYAFVGGDFTGGSYQLDYRDNQIIFTYQGYNSGTLIFIDLQTRQTTTRVYQLPDVKHFSWEDGMLFYTKEGTLYAEDYRLSPSVEPQEEYHSTRRYII
ncbi:MAG: hypothetical protein P4L65_06575 [Legionella sp.]|nr:hypothetical protein [Legionella sp.]